MLKTDRGQVLKALMLLANDEENALEKVRRSKNLSNGLGFGVLCASFFLALVPSFGIPAWATAIGASFGGALIGLGIWFENSLIQWPVLKEFLDLERLRSLSVESARRLKS